MKALSIKEASWELAKAFGNSFIHIHFLLFRLIDKIIFLFSRPKYKIYQRIWIGDNCYMIIGIYRDWEMEHYVYELLGADFNVSEGLIDFYQDREKLDNNPLNVV